MKRAQHMNARGMTLIEMLVAITASGIVLGTALTFMQQQQRAFARGSERAQALQNYRYAADILEKDLRTVGAGTASTQPFLVYADSNTIVFNADHTSRVVSMHATYVDSLAPAAAVDQLTPDRAIRIPGSTFDYPSVSYPNSSAETIVFFFRPDTLTSNGNDYVLYRQNNDQEPEVVARDLVRMPNQPFFKYIVHQQGAGGLEVDTVSGADLPLIHTDAAHGSPNDAMAIDSVRAIRLSLASTSDGAQGAVGRLQRLARMPNAGLALLQTCGHEPILGVALEVESSEVAGAPAVRIQWDPAVDQREGEEDIVNYLLWRQATGASTWGEPIASVPFNLQPFEVMDEDVAVGDRFRYKLQAADCTPALSEAVNSAWVLVEDPNL